MTPLVSLCMIVKNEERFLSRCLESVKGVVQEIIVADTGSSDNTINIARDFGAIVKDLPWPHDFSVARNFTLSLATGNWILVLDADEALDAGAKEFLDNEMKVPEVYGLLRRHYSNLAHDPLRYIVKKSEYPWDDAVCSYALTRDYRFFPRDSRLHYSGRVHESIEPSVHASTEYRTRESQAIIHHFGELKSGVEKSEKAKHYLKLGVEKLREDGGNWKAWFDLGVQFQAEGFHQEAINAFEAAAGLHEGHHLLWTQLGQSYLQLGKVEVAVNLFRRALSIRPDCILSWNSLGIALLQLSLVPEAMICFETILQSVPTNIAALVNLGDCLLLQERHNEAKARFESALREAPGNELLIMKIKECTTKSS